MRRNDKGEITHYQGIALDVTERKLMEAELQQAQKLESVGQLAAGIAHEINTPIQYVGNNLRFMQDSLADLLALSGRHAALLQQAKRGAVSDDTISEQKKALAQRDLWRKNQQLMDRVRRQDLSLASVEARHPGIADIKTDGSGSIVIEDEPGTLDEFMKKYFA